MGVIVNLCKTCGHPEAHHGPISGRRDDTGCAIPGRLCFYGENYGFERNLCDCSGFNQPRTLSFMDVVRKKLGTLKEPEHEAHT